MRFIPFERETIVSAASPASVAALLTSKTQMLANETGESKAFTGIVGEQGFRISLQLSKPQSFIPVVDGTIEETSGGSLIFVKYYFFRSTNFFLLFWCAITLALAFIFFGPAQNYLYGCLSLLGCVANYVIAMANFDVYLKQTKTVFYQVLDKLT